MKTKLFITALFVTASFLTTKAQYTKLLDFEGATNGSFPEGSLISDGTFLYGVTSAGGINNRGVVFKIKPDGTGYVKLHEFTGVASGSHPRGSLFFDGTFLYGMTFGSGSIDSDIFKIKPDGTEYSQLHAFTVSDGARPPGTLISDGTFLYGMTEHGGTGGVGIIFKIKPDGTEFAKLLDFAGANGINPRGSFISDGTFLYGVTSYGGSNGDGIIFKIKPDGTGFAKLLDFVSETHGDGPVGSLIYDGTFLYGMTLGGGSTDSSCSTGCGVVFKIKPDGTGYAKLLDFAITSNGRWPFGSLISEGAFLYGMTNFGGINDVGIIFKIKPDGSGYAQLFDFIGVNGTHPRGSLLSDGTFLYGMSNEGGTDNLGVIFKYALATGIAEHPAKGGFNVYPNPTSGKFTIEMNGSQGAKGEAEIYNVMGEKVHQQTLNSKLQTLNLNVPGGVYFIHILTEQGTASRKIVVSE